MKPALKYGLIGFVLAVVLFLLIPGGSDNATTDMSSITASNAQEEITSGVTEESYEITDSDISDFEDNAESEPVIEVEESIDWSQIIVKQKTETLEYSKKSTDPLKYISCDDEDVYIDTDDEINLSNTGKQTITYTLTKDGQTKDIELTFKVKDTKRPKISFVKKAPKITVGDSYDPLDNIKSVKDPVDGSLKYTSSDDPGKGEYSVKGYYDTGKKGTYEIKVIARDKHGNKKSRTFKLKVKAPVNVSTNVSGSSGYFDAPSDSGSDYILNTNTRKFHYPWCHSVNQMAEHNKEYFTGSRDEVINRGYSPCGNCNP